MISNLTEVPPNWIKVRFDEIAENITDRIDKPNESGLEYYIGLEHLDTDQIRIKRFGSTDDVNATKFICKKGDIIFGKRRSYLRKVAVTDRDAVASAHSMVIRPKGDLIVPEFLPCFMQSSVFWKTAHAISEGSMSPTIKWKTLAKQEFLVPTIDEQNRISDILWSIEVNTETVENILKLTRVLKISLLNKLLTNGIEHNNFKITEIGEIPEEWDVVKLIDMADIIMGQSPPSSSYNDSDGLPFLQGKADFGDIEPIITKYTTKPSKISEKGDILFTVRAPVGDMNWCNTTCCIGRGIAALRPKETVIPKFLYYQLDKLRSHFEQLSQGSTFTAINSKELKNFSVVVPPLDEQKEIVNILYKLDLNISQFNNHILYVSNLKKKITNDFLSGKLTIPKEVL